MQAIWTAGQPDPHRASAIFRQALGALDFANMPLSADFSKPLAGPGGRSMFADFRPDVDWPGQYGVTTGPLPPASSRRCAAPPSVSLLNSITHNPLCLSGRRDPVYCRLRVVLDEMMAACGTFALRPVGRH
jgi:hypothetical protein